MPRSSRTATYGPEYEQLLLKADAGVAASGSWLMPTPSPSVAQSLKSKLYAYFNALRREGLRPDLIAIADRTSLRAVNDGVVFFSVEDTWDAILIREALGLEKRFAVLGQGSGTPIEPPKSAHSALLGRLAESRARRNPK